jgi:hypothetical protein
MKSLLAFWLSLIFIPALSQVYPPPSCVNYNNGLLTICPPDSVPANTGGLLGYNVNLDGEFIENLPAGSPEDTVTMTFDPLPLPGYRTFCANAVYQDWISDFTCDTALVYYGYDLPFTENWSSGSFETNNWTGTGGYWTIENNGAPELSVSFSGDAVLTNYFVPLTSFIFLADSIFEGNIRLTFSLKLDCNNSTGAEKLYPQVWDWENQVWNNAIYPLPSNSNGSIDWTDYTAYLTNTRGKLFKVRFVAQGEISTDISKWYIDNIHVFRTCLVPGGLSTGLNDENQVELWWSSPTGCGEYWLFLWWYNYESGNSIGTGDAAEFDVAARWTADQLADYENTVVNRIYFFPAEAAAEYTVRVWKGDSATLVYEQTVPNPEINHWNYVQLEDPPLIDISQDLWIGYHIETSTGYPAGVDVGPAVNGNGNMMYWEGQWKTLLEINPELDYNWLIEGYIGEGNPQYCGNRIYRKINGGDYIRIVDIPMDFYFLDDQADPADLNCYMVTDVFAKNYDTCESPYSNESCLQPVIIQEDNLVEDLLIYPNPASDELFISSSSEIIEMQMIDITGRIVYIERKPTQLVKIPVRDYSSGVYFLKISLKEKLMFRKVVID